MATKGRKPLKKGEKISKSSNAARSKGVKKRYSDKQKVVALTLLERYKGNLTKTAKELQMPKSTLKEWRDNDTLLMKKDDVEWMDSNLEHGPKAMESIKNMDIDFLIKAKTNRSRLLDILMDMAEKEKENPKYFYELANLFTKVGDQIKNTESSGEDDSSKPNLFLTNITQFIKNGS